MDHSEKDGVVWTGFIWPIGQQWPTYQVDSVSPHPEELKKKTCVSIMMISAMLMFCAVLFMIYLKTFVPTLTCDLNGNVHEKLFSLCIGLFVSESGCCFCAVASIFMS
jgi:hypothetical protein